MLKIMYKKVIYNQYTYHFVFQSNSHVNGLEGRWVNIIK